MFNDMELMSRIVAMPTDTNPAGNIFGGWILSQIDLAGAIAARVIAPERVVTVSMKEVVFKEPVFIGDIVSCYTKILSVGNTSISVQVEVTTERLSKSRDSYVCQQVTSANVTYVSIDTAGNKKPIDPEIKARFGF